MLVIGRPHRHIEEVLLQIDEMVKLRVVLEVPPYPEGYEHNDPYCYVKYIKWYMQQEQQDETGHGT